MKAASTEEGDQVSGRVDMSDARLTDDEALATVEEAILMDEEAAPVDDDAQGRDEKHEKMTTAPVERLVLKMAGPSIVIMLISAVYNMADTFYVGMIGTTQTAAVGVSFSLMALIQAIGFFFGHGAGNYISRALGAKNFENASKMAATGLITALIVGSVIGIVGLFNLEALARMLGATDTILPYACDYLFYILIGTPWMAASLMLNNLLRFQGSAFYGMIGMTSGVFLNVILDPLCILYWGMGAAGAALSTMLGQLLSFVVLLIGCTKRGNVRIQPRKFTPRLSMYKEMLRGGTPSLFRQGIMSVATILLNQVAGRYGDAAIAAIAIVQRVTMISTSALFGLGQGFQPVCGFNYGAGLYRRVKRAYWFSVQFTTALLIAISIAAYIFAPGIIRIFRADDPEVIRIGAQALRYQCMTLPLMGLIVISNMMLQTIGEAIRASITAIARQGLFMLPFLYFLTANWGLIGIQLCQPAADVATILLTVPLAVSTLKRMTVREPGLRT